jgi:Cys-rich protein (TIGR01571 family)
MSNQWQHGLFGCFDNCTVCILSYLAPCYVQGKNAEAVGENCLLCGLVFFVPLANLWFGATIRQKVRESKGIEGGLVGDLLAFWCCTCCAVAQSAQEVGSVGGGMALDMERQ